MSRFRRPSLGDGFGYVPGEQPDDVGGWIKLNTNESPLPPSMRVSDAINEAVGSLNRYPHPAGEPLRSALALHHGVDPLQIAVGNGADGLIDACFRAFCEPDSAVVLTEPTYSLLSTVARVHGGHPRAVAIGPDGEPASDFATLDAPLRFLVNPNTPTGTWLAPERLEELLETASGVVVVDEAYCDFAPASCIPFLGDHPSWLVLRSFSKSHALAGLRVGYAVGSRDLIADLVAVGDSYPLGRCAIAGAVAAIEDADYHRGLVEMVISERERVTTALTQQGWHLTPSRANFVCGRPETLTAAEVAERLRARRVLVRSFGSGEMGVVRITIGTSTENDALLAALR